MKDYKIELSSISVKQKEKEKIYPLMQISVSGTPGLGTIREMMEEIDELSKTIKGEYIAVTDFRGLKIGKFLQSIIIFGMEKTYKKILSVANPAILSFAIFPKEQRDSELMKDSLETINNDKGFKYRYVFINDPDEVKSIVERLENA